jgi:hypothetical protein
MYCTWSECPTFPTLVTVLGGRITTGIICIRIKMGMTITISETIRITTLKRTMTSRPTVVGKWGRQAHG